jgi:cbb3-type cytochrome oxidase subunit 3
MNNPFALPSPGKSADWLIFAVMILTIGIAIAIVVVWMTVYRPKNKKKRRKQRRHHRQHNPTLAQTGGLPPMRDPDEPPPGP